jgi:hypothetical protein
MCSLHPLRIRPRPSSANTAPDDYDKNRMRTNRCERTPQTRIFERCLSTRFVGANDMKLNNSVVLAAAAIALSFSTEARSMYLHSSCNLNRHEQYLLKRTEHYLTNNVALTDLSEGIASRLVRSGCSVLAIRISADGSVAAVRIRRDDNSYGPILTKLARKQRFRPRGHAWTGLTVFKFVP